MYKIVVYSPITHADKIRQVLAESGAGKMGNYQACSFSCRGIGRFMPTEGANPFSGTVGELDAEEEERIETICAEDQWEDILEKIKEAHPYEEPAIGIYPLIYPR